MKIKKTITEGTLSQPSYSVLICVCYHWFIEIYFSNILFGAHNRTSLDVLLCNNNTVSVDA